VDLHVCYGTFGSPERHPCKRAHEALANAGHSPTIVKTGGCYGTDRLWSGRRNIKRLTGSYKVPTLFLDDGSIVDGTANIVAWAEANPASGS
jgi:glutaredoxin